MKDFEEAFPTADDLNDVGVRRLGAAILLQAAADYYKLLEAFSRATTARGRCMCVADASEIGAFVNGPLYSSLTDMKPGDFYETVNNWFMRRKRLPRFITTWRDRLESMEEEERPIYYEPSYLRNLLDNPALGVPLGAKDYEHGGNNNGV